MRLNANQISTIVQTSHAIAGEGVLVWLYGSRLNDERSGGDVDLLIQSKLPLGLLKRAKIKLALEEKLQLPVDVLVSSDAEPNSPFVTIARKHAQLLSAGALQA